MGIIRDGGSAIVHISLLKGTQMRLSRVLSALALFAGTTFTSLQANDIYGLSPGRPDIQTISAMAFGPDGILFIGDSKGGTVHAVRTGDQKSDAVLTGEIPGINQQIAKAIGSVFEAVKITDMAVNPETGHVFISAQVEGKPPRIFYVTEGESSLSELDLNNIPFATAPLPNPAEDKDIKVGNRSRNNRSSAITDLAFANGQLVVAGLSNREEASNVWSMRFPFDNVDEGTALEYYHGAHGRFENYGPIRTFVPMIVNGEPSLLAGFVCTPLVRFPMAPLTDSEKKAERVKGTTVAELGNRNQPLDMISYKKDGKEYLLLANSARGVMKITTDDIARTDGITEPVPDGQTAGQKFEKIESLVGTVQLDKLNDTQAVVLIQDGNGPMTLKVIDLP